MSFKLNGNRLKEARRYRQLTIAGLADQAGVSKQMISRYERETATPGLEVFQQLVKVLRFPLNFFTQSDQFNYKDEGTFFRSRLTSTQAEKTPSETYKKAAGVVRDFFGRYIEFPDLFRDGISSTAPRAAAIEVRKAWKLGDKPIDNMMRLLESHGIIVSVVNSGSAKVDAHSGYVWINDNQYYLVQIDTNSHTFYRQQFGLAHELGHFILHADTFDPQTLEASEYRQMEKEADDFASEFLLPSKAFEKTLKSEKMNLDWYLKLKGVWYVSAATMVYRARNLRLLTADEYLKLQKRISYRGWRKEEPFDNIKNPNSPELLKQSLDLLEDANIVKPRLLSSIIGDEYGIEFPNEILAQVIGVPINKFNADIVQLKFKK
jgi:Predicted Zn peptidase